MFKRNQLLFLVPLLSIQLAMQSCSKKKEDFNIIEMTLEKSTVSLTPSSSLSVNITAGNGSYTAVSSNNSVATAKISDNVLTITAVTKEDRAHAVIIVTDKMFKRQSIDVEISKLFEMTLSTIEANLEVGVPAKSEVVVNINTGNAGY